MRIILSLTGLSASTYLLLPLCLNGCHNPGNIPIIPLIGVIFFAVILTKHPAPNNLVHAGGFVALILITLQATGLYPLCGYCLIADMSAIGLAITARRGDNKLQNTSSY